MPRQLIINADDFGRSPEINRAVIRAHREGILTSASLMIGAPAAEEAVELARLNPTLAVGLHLVVVDGPAVLPPDRIPHLVNDGGHFPNQPVRLGLRYAFSKVARRELGEEIAAQFERFNATGLPMAHVDGHQHMHMHPAVFDLMLPLAQHYRAGRIRIVRDDLRLALQYDGHHRIAKALSALIFARLARRCERRLSESAFQSPREPSGSAAGRPEHRARQNPTRTYGFFQSGHMSEPYVLLALQHMHDSTEIYFHPTDGPRFDDLGPNPGDLQTLLSRTVRDAIEARGLLQNMGADMSRHSDPDLRTVISTQRHSLPATVQ